jgi:hypothetical protein
LQTSSSLVGVPTRDKRTTKHEAQAVSLLRSSPMYWHSPLRVIATLVTMGQTQAAVRSWEECPWIRPSVVADSSPAVCLALLGERRPRVETLTPFGPAEKPSPRFETLRLDSPNLLVLLDEPVQPAEAGEVDASPVGHDG